MHLDEGIELAGSWIVGGVYMEVAGWRLHMNDAFKILWGWADEVAFGA